MRPPPLPHQIDVLERVLERIPAMVAQGGHPVCVFDLEGALYDSRPKTLQILLEYAEEVRVDYPDVTDAIQTLDADRIHYLLSDTLRECALTHADTVRDIAHFWRERFFTDEYCTFDVATPGAPEYVRACHEAGATVVYLTARDLPGMLVGTVRSLRDCGFPLGVAGVELILKPDATMGDEAFKRATVPLLERVGDIAAFFATEPSTCNMARHLFNDADVALLETIKVPGAPPADHGIDLVVDFRIV